MIAPNGIAKRAQINTAVAAVVRETYPQVQHIRYSIRDDWSGELAVFFRVLLSDEASDRKNLHGVTSRVVSLMSDKLDLPTLGLFPYFDFRSESEQAARYLPEWAAAS